MELSGNIWTSPSAFIATKEVRQPTLFFAPSVLSQTAARFQAGFPGQVTYAVKANSADNVLLTLAASGITAFDVASPAEISQTRALLPDAALHYNNPIRSRDEIAFAVAEQVCSYSVDCASELDKLLSRVPPDGTELSVRFKLPVKGAAYDFGSKFGATPEEAATLLARAAHAGFTPSLTFHPGTQCPAADAWTSYIDAAAKIAQQAGVRIARLNTGGGFPAHRMQDEPPQLEGIFDQIAQSTQRAFGDDAPALLCEPGRGMVAESHALLVQVKARKASHTLYLNDGVYGALSELRDIGETDRVVALDAEGRPKTGALVAYELFGPTCDSIDRLPGLTRLPDGLDEGDHLLFFGVGAYSTALATRFNGFGDLRLETCHSLT